MGTCFSLSLIFNNPDEINIYNPNQFFIPEIEKFSLNDDYLQLDKINCKIIINCLNNYLIKKDKIYNYWKIYKNVVNDNYIIFLRINFYKIKVYQIHIINKLVNLISIFYLMKGGYIYDMIKYNQQLEIEKKYIYTIKKLKNNNYNIIKYEQTFQNNYMEVTSDYDGNLIINQYKIS